MTAPRIVRCPACAGDSVYGPDNPFRPFCSARCKGIDFGAWASESFRLAAAPPDGDSAADLTDLPPGPPTGRGPH